MDWVLRSPQLHSTFGNLGLEHGDGYQVNENCNVALEAILHNILTENKHLRTYRRSISFGQNIKKDLIPLLIHAKDEKTIELLVRILVNLTIPSECLISIDSLSKTDFGRHSIFELNNLLTAAKCSFTDHRVTKIVIEFLRKNVETDQSQLTHEQCANINNCLLLMRNVLHIPEELSGPNPNHNGSTHTVQNQILWNIFSQSIDKILIKLMTIPETTNWAVTMVQLIALLYKDQHVVTLHKLLNLWLETSISESSEDNESNTSPPDRGRDDSSPILTSDPTSDSSDNGGSGKSNDGNNIWPICSHNNVSETTFEPFKHPLTPPPSESKHNHKSKHKLNQIKYRSDVEITKKDGAHGKSRHFSSLNFHNGSDIGTKQIPPKSDPNLQDDSNSDKKAVKSETSDCGYGTQNLDSISTSSNEDELPSKKPVHQKPLNPKQKKNTARPAATIQEKKRKKITKRGKLNIINVQGLSHKTPTDDDISNVLKEFTVDFLLKGYNSLVKTLHRQLLTNVHLEIDTSHFFWLVTYFLKFATQIELDFENVCSVLSFDIISYLAAEGVNLCEQFELAVKLEIDDLKHGSRRLHLVVTAIRELIQTIQVYKKFTHLNAQDHVIISKLQQKVCETEELRSMFVLLLRHYNPKYHSKQYLQDLIVTNHILLLFLDNVMLSSDYTGTANMLDHIKQFATPKVMCQYGLLLEDYSCNGEFINDCIFTIMHHVGGDLDSLICLFQPKLLKTFSTIWNAEFEICDDWADLIEYVINSFVKKPHTLHNVRNFGKNIFNDKDFFFKQSAIGNTSSSKKKSEQSLGNENKWTDDEISSLSWNYMQCKTLSDYVGEIVKLFKDDGISKKRGSVIEELNKHKIINKEEYDNLIKSEKKRNVKSTKALVTTDGHNKEAREDEIGKLCEHLIKDGKNHVLDWVQKVLLDTCFAKLFLEKNSKHYQASCTIPSSDVTINSFELFKQKYNDMPVISPVSYHSLLLDQAVPLVPWNCEQSLDCKDLKFLQLLHRLGFHMPVDTGKVFIRIPNFWTADYLYEVAGRVSPIDTSKLSFSEKELSSKPLEQTDYSFAPELLKTASLVEPPENYYQIHKQKRHSSMVQFTPMPGSSFYHGGGNEILNNKANWFDLVQKSQEYKFALTTASTRTELVIKSIAPDLLVEEVKLESTFVAENLDLSAYHLSEYGDNNSVCETASVASHLTRMYMSDEDEKPILAPPLIEIKTRIDDPFSSDSDVCHPEKRPRVHFGPTF